MAPETEEATTEDARITHAREILAAYDAGNHDVTGHLAAAVRMLLEVAAERDADLDQLLAVATLYVSAFTADEMMTLPEKLMLQEVEAVLDRHGRRY